MGRAGAPYFQFIKAQCEVQDLCELLGQRLLPLQVLSGVVVSLAGQSSQEAVQRCLCKKNTIYVLEEHQPFCEKYTVYVGFYFACKDEGLELRY